MTGCLNLTIDKAPIIPKDSAILPEIVFVIIYVITGKTMNATVCAWDLAQACPVKLKENLNNNPLDINRVNDGLLSRGFRMDRGYGKLRGDAFRIAHMGNVMMDDLIEYLHNFDEVLNG